MILRNLVLNVKLLFNWSVLLSTILLTVLLWGLSLSNLLCLFENTESLTITNVARRVEVPLACAWSSCATACPLDQGMSDHACMCYRLDVHSSEERHSAWGMSTNTECTDVGWCL